MPPKNYWSILLFNLFYILPFTFYYLSRKNYEFLWYVSVLVFFYVLILATLPKSKFDGTILWGLSLWGFLHMAGGGIRIGENVLYDLVLFPVVLRGEITILKFDQFVHFFGFAVTTLAGFHLLRPHLNQSVNWKVISFILVGFGMGMGALNEVVEFIAVTSFSQTGVGGYTNTALDLVFNLFGALAVVPWIRYKTFRRHGTCGTVLKPLAGGE